MSERSVEHATFAIERSYDASPARVFAAWADPAAKARWFGGHEAEESEFELDFRIGGREVNRGRLEGGGPLFSYEALYQDIVREERIVYSYDMHLDETRISVSLSTVEFKPDGEGTRLVYTEQGAFLDGHDSAEQRQQGTAGIFDALGKELEREPASA
jgi:uncharacterized protein YndB with AHSA1/START domain